LARNAGVGEVRLWEFVACEPVEPEALAGVYLNPGATEELRFAAVVRSWAAGGLDPALVGHLGQEALVLALESGEPVAVHGALRAVLTTVDAGHRAVAYAALARAGAMESVWTLELERVGVLQKTDAAVRASMTGAGAGPLLAAVDDAAIAADARRRAREG
jgi:hypothetical protein